MKTKKSLKPEIRLTGEQIVQKKLDEMNAMLKKTDLSKLPGRTEAKQDNEHV